MDTTELRRAVVGGRPVFQVVWRGQVLGWLEGIDGRAGFRLVTPCPVTASEVDAGDEAHVVEVRLTVA